MALHIWLNAILALLTILAVVGIPLWMTFWHPDQAPDFGEANAYLAAKAEAAENGWQAPVTSLQPALTHARHAPAA